MELVTVTADYRRTADGWQTLLTAPQLGTRAVGGADLRAAFDAVLGASADVASRLGRTCRTVHRLDGDPDAFAALAGTEGLAGGGGDASVTVCEPRAVAWVAAGAPKARCPYAHGRSR